MTTHWPWIYSPRDDLVNILLRRLHKRSTARGKLFFFILVRFGVLRYVLCCVVCILVNLAAGFNIDLEMTKRSLTKLI